MTTRNYYCANRYNVETGEWKYAPRYASVDHGQVEITEIERSDTSDNDDENDNQGLRL
jgi:hypothetical protein